METRRKRLTSLVLTATAVVAFALPLAAQGGSGAAQNAAAMINQSSDPLLKNFRFRSIGPASMGGRIDDIAVSESNPSIIYLGYAVGGVWKSENNGTTFHPVFDTHEVASVGDIAIHPTNPNIVYVGTGEPNNRQSSSFGAGMYKTTNGGQSWQYIGLRETQTIARVVIDPRNPETIYVAALGALFGPNQERGVYKSTDGGRTWNRVHYIDENTGITDLQIDHQNPNTLYAASYQRRRTTCCFNGGGPGSGLWKSTDAGRTWTKLSGNGLPPGTYGRIALDVARSNPNIVYAQIEAGNVGQVIQPGQGRGGGGFGGGGGYNWCNNAGPGRGFGGRGGGRGGEQPAGPQTPPALNPAQGGVFRSDNGGRTWRHVSNCNARPMYFSQLRVDPQNPDYVYVAGLPIAKSLDGGRTFVTLDDAGGNGSPGHVDVHAIWINPRNSNHIMNGNDGGLDISYDQGRTWISVKTMAAGTFYAVSYDMRRPYWVCGGLQDNGSWCAPSAVRSGDIMNDDWFRIGGGDGFYTAQDPNDFNIVYAESQNGNTNRLDLRTGRGGSIRPRAPELQQVDVPAGRGGGGGGRGGGPPNVVNGAPGDQYRFNWNTPYQLSTHNSSVVWLGGDRLFKSYNRGDTWVASPDLTKAYDRNTHEIMGQPGNVTMLSKNDGISMYSTIITVSESPIKPGLVWVGTDDGNVQVTRDDMATFTEVGRNIPGLPAGHMYWVSRVAASAHDTARAYVAVDGHRSNDLKPYLYVTNDFGRTWTPITNGLPAYGNIQVVTEDAKNPDLLFVGTEFGLYVSLNRGQSWQKFMNNYPTVRTDDIRIHPRDGDVIVGTHGRSIWIADDITPLQQLTPAVRSADATLFDIRPAVAYLTDRKRMQQVTGQMVFSGENAPQGTFINYHLRSAATGDVKITITDAAGRVVRNLDGTREAGINRVPWELDRNPVEGGRGGGRGGGGGGGGFGGGGGSVAPGTYLVTLNVGNLTLTKTVEVLEDRWMEER
ncbi:MAG TPA: hypothetical protein VLE53_10975 [Gemmatimonadaceae bacterium]|nr:hypothetical protein [Gemmatimonadaceae bacterium]